jgi:hypothetical protein
MKKFLLLAVLCNVSIIACANDSAIQGTSGTPAALGSIQKVRVLRGEHPSVRMVRERVDVVVRLGDYDVVANFVFHNSGAARTVLMGFPEGAGGDVNFEGVKKKTTFKSFATWVDGRRISARRVLANEPNEDGGLDAYWVKAVRFGRNQTRKVRVAYRAPLGDTSLGENFLSYDFTGGNWKGKVDESVLTIRFAGPGYYLFPNYDLGTKRAWKWRRENTFFYRWRDWQAQEEFSFYFIRTLPGAMVLASKLAELSQPWPSLAGATVFDIKPSVGKFNVWRSSVGLAPQGVLRDGLAFIQLRSFSDRMRQRWEGRHKRTASSAAGLYVKNGLYIAPNYGGRRVLSFSPGDPKATIGLKTVTLPAAPFLAGGAFYIPLAATVKALHGTVQINTKTRRVYFDVPM